MENHTHNGLDSPQLEPSDALQGFPIFTSAPTHDAPEGTIVLYSTGGVYRLYARLNKGWRVIALT